MNIKLGHGLRKAQGWAGAIVGVLATAALLPAPLRAGEATARSDKVSVAVVGFASPGNADRIRQINEAILGAARRLSDGGPVSYDIETADDGCTPDGARNVANRLAGRGVMLVIGHPCEAAAAAAAQVYAAHDIIFFATGTRHPDFTANRAGPSVFRLAGSDAAQGVAAADALKAAAGERPIAIVHDRTRYAKTIAEGAAAALKAENRDAVTATIIAGDKEYGRLVAKIKDAGGVFFAGFPLEAGFIASALRGAGSTAQFITSDAVATREFTSSFPAEARRTQVLHATRQDAGTTAVAALEIFAAALARVRTQEKAAADLRAIAVVLATGPSTSATGNPDDEKPKGAEGKGPAGRRSAATDTAAAPPTRAQRLAAAITEGSYATGLGEIRFEKNGGAVLPSYDLKTWDGTEWVAVSTLRR